MSHAESASELAPPASNAPAVGEHWMGELGHLLNELQEASSHTTVRPVLSEQADNQLVQVRLGVAASLFAALQFKSAVTAGHCLRIALTTSIWAHKLDLPAEERDLIEVASLLHDIGVIGVPEHVLHKPAALDSDETSLMLAARKMSCAILARASAAPELLQLVEYVPAHYNGSTDSLPLSGKNIPRGARMIAIVEAFDSMTTDRVYRPAMSLEAAMTELFQCAGAQFDPDLVADFVDLYRHDQTELRKHIANRWLATLDPELVNTYWQHNCIPSQPELRRPDLKFQTKLLENMYDAVLFIDASFQIIQWNHGAERLTGIAEAGMLQRAWTTDLLGMADEKGRPVRDADCPIRSAIQSGVQSLRRLSICGRSGRTVSVDAHAIPVPGDDGKPLGAVLLLHDASSETTLEQRCQSLYEKATKDPLTQVANRAEFDRVHAMFVAAHQQQQVPCSMMIGDLDRFKQINDVYGHQAGDEAIKSLANLLKSSCRPGDLVARYGGEEFVMLFADCDNATAARRSEQIRKSLAQLPLPVLDGRSITASFGVTEVQPGDTPETMLRRADRALLMAKAKGRNMVVQLGSGGGAEPASSDEPARASKGDSLLQRTLITPVPIKIAVEKLRGFVADHQAEIVAVEGNNIRLQIGDGQGGWMRRITDRAVDFIVQLKFEEERYQKDTSEPGSNSTARTRIQVEINPKKARDRRRADLQNRAREVLVSFRSYLMATEVETENDAGMLDKVKRILTPWMNPAK